MDDLANYVLANYGRLTTEHERAVLDHLTGLFKARRRSPQPGTAQDTENAEQYLHRLSDDPAVIEDAQAGWEQARMRIAQRILDDHPDEVYLNHCPECEALTRTPTARLCLSCGYSWHHVPRDVRL